MTLQVSDAPPAVRPSAAELERVLQPLVDGASARGRQTLVSVTLAVPWHDPIALFDAARAVGAMGATGEPAAPGATGAEPALWFQPGAGFALVAIGAAWTIQPAGPARFRQAALAWRALLDGASVVDAPAGARGTGPLLIGGFGFCPEPSKAPAWRGFERGRLVLPSLLVTIDGGAAWLTANVVVPSDGAEADGPTVTRELTELWAAVERGARAGAESEEPTKAAPAEAPPALVPDGPPAAATLRIAGLQPGPDEWRASVGRLAGAVGRGRADKVVLARRVDLVAPAPVDLSVALRRLEVTARESTIFALTRHGRTFLGATPERLVRVEGRTLRTIALAGSIGRGSDPAGDEHLAAELLASAKDREEHEVVVEMLRRTLAPLAEELEVAADPVVVTLRHVQHLATEVRGRLRQQAGVLSLVERLHPTPAVGGAPRELALELIAAEERLDRGWYAGPLGWLDRHDDGEFVVAIRSGVVEDDRVSLFAGCGIVADSDPDREWAESEMKLEALASALGRLER